MAFLNNAIAPRLSGQRLLGDVLNTSVPAGGVNWLEYLKLNSNSAFYASTGTVDPFFVERVQTATLRRLSMGKFCSVYLKNVNGKVVFRSPELPFREMKASRFRYLSMDYLRVSAAFLSLCLSQRGVWLEGQIRLPFHQVRLSSGRYRVELEMSDPSCSERLASLLSRVSLSAKDKVAVDQNGLAHGFAEA